MSKSEKSSKNEYNNSSDTQIIGFRLPKSLAHSVKIEAAHRQLSLKELFAEMWDLYKSEKK